MLMSDFDRQVVLNKARHEVLLAEANQLRMLAQQAPARPKTRRYSVISFLRVVANAILHPQRFRSQTV